MKQEPGKRPFRIFTRRNIVVGVFLLAALLLVPAFQVLYVGFTEPGENSRRGNLKLADVSPEFKRAVWVSEDYRFFRHRGFDWTEIRIAREEAARTGQPARGASTITQQSARSIFLWQGRSWLRKVLEAYYTIWMEALLSKERIFELYVNAIELGDGIYGIGDAARHYYGVSASELTPEQAALLVAIMPNPKGWDPRAPNSTLLVNQAEILRRSGEPIRHLAPDHAGEKFAYARWRNFKFRLTIVDLQTLEETEVVDTDDVTEIYGWSPDGRYLAFVQNPTPTRENWISVWDKRDGSVRRVSPNAIRFYGWSADGRHLVFLHRRPEPRQDTVRVWDAEGDRVRRLTADEDVFESSFTWLSDSTYFFISRPQEGRERTFWGDLSMGAIKPAPIYIREDNFIAISDRRAAFAYSENIYGFDVAPENPVASEPPRITQISQFSQEDFDSLKGLHYSKETGQYLFNARPAGSRGQYLFRYRPGNNLLERLSDHPVHNGKFLQKGRGFFYVGSCDDGLYLAVRPDSSEEKRDFFVGGRIVDLVVSPGGDRIYIYGASEGGTLAIWEYDLGKLVIREISSV